MKKISFILKGFIFSFILLAVISFSVDSHATNGTQMIGYGSKSVGMGGADLAIANDATAINANPATLTGLKSEIDFDFTAFGPQVHHTASAMGNDADGKNPYFYMPLLAYVSGGGPVSWGIGIFPQGGMGVDYKDKVKNGMGQTDSLYSNLSYMRIVPAVAYQVNEQFSLGLGLQLGYSTFDMEFFPKFNAGAMGQGMEFKNASSYAYGARIGALFKANEQVSIGAIYNTKQSFDYEGDIKYGSGTSGKAKFKDFAWPSEIGIGISYKPFEELTLGLDVSQLQWSDAVNKPYLDPAIAGFPNAEFKMEWENQTVIALGGAYKLNDSLTGRIGYNYGKSPVPDKNLSPLFPAIQESHYTLGLGYAVEGSPLMVDGYLAVAPEAKQTNSSNADLGGISNTEKMSQTTFGIQVGYRF